MTPLEIFNAIENFTEAKKEMLAILTDEDFSEELMKRRSRCPDRKKFGSMVIRVENNISQNNRVLQIYPA